MATSYTSLLGLALPVTGELDGTWGDTVNNSITSLLDTAVAGTTTLSTDADVTLTTTTGASNQARQAILLCSGARTAVRNITAPAQSKIYAVVNNTTGGYGVVIRGAGPTTGVTVANGKTAVVVWNGSDFVEVSPATATNLSGGAAGSVPYQTADSTTAMLAIGAANYVLTSTGTAPAWTANTGTGNVVRATSPTLATPTITTSATVPLLIGGTGTTSTLTLRATSGVGTTNSDIIFQVGNNGATEAMRILNNANVGIGTITPSSPLTVYAANNQATLRVTNGPSANNVGITLEALGGNVVLNNGNGPLEISTGGSVRAALTTAGNMGLGTSSPTNRLDVVGASGSECSILLRSQSSVANTYQNARFQFELVASATATRDLDLVARQEATGTGGALAYEYEGTEFLRVDSGGKLLIGQTASRGTVSANLQVSDSRISITSSANGILGGIAPSSSTSNSITIEADPDNVAASSFISFNIDATERARMTSTGRFGFGTTSPATNFVISNAGADGFEFTPGSTCQLVAYNRSGLSYSAAQIAVNSLTIQTGAAPANQFQFDASGNALVVGAGGLGYGTGSGGAVTQATSRTTGVTLNKTNGAITLVSAAGTTAWQSFTVTNSTVAATDVVKVCQKSGTDLYLIHVTAVAAGSFRISFATTGGTTTEQPIFNFAVIKAVTA